MLIRLCDCLFHPIGSLCVGLSMLILMRPVQIENILFHQFDKNLLVFVLVFRILIKITQARIIDRMNDRNMSMFITNHCYIDCGREKLVKFLFPHFQCLFNQCVYFYTYMGSWFYCHFYLLYFLYEEYKAIDGKVFHIKWFLSEIPLATYI